MIKPFYPNSKKGLILYFTYIYIKWKNVGHKYSWIADAMRNIYLNIAMPCRTIMPSPEYAAWMPLPYLGNGIGFQVLDVHWARSCC